jgi:DNA ligase-1
MSITEILEEIKTTTGNNAKKEILSLNRDNKLLKKALKYGLDPFVPFNIVKVPKVKNRLDFLLDESAAWKEFFTIADECSTRTVSGNAAIDRVYACFCSVSEEDEGWMRKILKKHLAIGASTKTVNKVFPNLVPTFEISLAQKFEEKRLKGKKIVYVEPKLDGIRCFAIVESNKATLYARSGKLITNFDKTIGKDLSKLPDGCYDGEIMGMDFIALMRQAYRKDNVETKDTYLALFDFLSLTEWKSKIATKNSRSRYEYLYKALRQQCLVKDLEYLRIVERRIVEANYDKIMKAHNEFVDKGYEGAMIKDPDAFYEFGRSFGMMKLKAFHDVDLSIESLIEGTGKHSGKLGSVVVDYNGVKVQVGSGFSDELREAIWADSDNFVKRMIEVRYQEVTPDGSLRFPTFVCFRNDR